MKACGYRGCERKCASNRDHCGRCLAVIRSREWRVKVSFHEARRAFAAEVRERDIAVRSWAAYIERQARFMERRRKEGVSE